MGAARWTQGRDAVIVSAPLVCCVSGPGCGDGTGGEGGADGGAASSRPAFSARLAEGSPATARRERGLAAALAKLRDLSVSRVLSASARATACSVDACRQSNHENQVYAPATGDRSGRSKMRADPTRAREDALALRAASCCAMVSLSLSERLTSMSSLRSHCGCERALEGGAILATLGVSLVVGLEARLHTVGVERAVVVVDEVVPPKAVGAFGVVLGVRRFSARRVALFSFRQFSGVFDFEAQVGGRTRGHVLIRTREVCRTRTTQRGHRAMRGIKLARAQRAAFGRHREGHSGRSQRWQRGRRLRCRSVANLEQQARARRSPCLP
eukprot:1755436-Pleurochrysis_carterae.AAC.1